MYPPRPWAKGNWIRKMNLMYTVSRLNDGTTEEFDDFDDAVDRSERLSLMYGDPVDIHNNNGHRVAVVIDGEATYKFTEGQKEHDSNMAYIAIQHTDNKVVAMVVANSLQFALGMFNDLITDCYFERVTHDVASNSWLKQWQGHGQPALDMPKPPQQLELFGEGASSDE